MQDLFAESGLSSGAVYRYFAGKDDMVVAIAEENMRDVVTMLHTFAADDAASTGLGEALGRVLEAVRDKHADDELGGMALLVWSEAQRNPSLAAQFNAVLAPMRSDLTEIVRDHQDRGDLPGGPSPDAIATTLMAIVPGFILQLSLFGPKTVAGVPDAVRALWPARDAKPRARPQPHAKAAT